MELITVEEKDQILQHPYGYTKNFISNKITPAENRVMVKILEKIKYLQTIGQEPEKNLFGDCSFYFDAKDLIINNAVDRLDKTIDNVRKKTWLLPSTMTEYNPITGKHERSESVLTTGFIIAFERKVKDFGENKGKVRIELYSKMYDYLLNLSGGFTPFINKTSFALSNSYSIKLYYHIRQWFKVEKYENTIEQLNAGGKAKVHFKFEELKDVFNLPASYNAGSIKRRILDPAKKELDEKSEVSFNYSTVKGARNKIIAYSFVFYRNKSSFKTTIKLTALETKLIEQIIAKYNLSALKRTLLTGIISKYGYDLVMTVISMKHAEILKYMKEYKHDIVKTLGFLCEGELNNSVF